MTTPRAPMSDDDLDALMARADVWLAAKKKREADEAAQRSDRPRLDPPRPRSTTIARRDARPDPAPGDPWQGAPDA